MHIQIGDTILYPKQTSKAICLFNAKMLLINGFVKEDQTVVVKDHETIISSVTFKNKIIRVKGYGERGYFED